MNSSCAKVDDGRMVRSAARRMKPVRIIFKTMPALLLLPALLSCSGPAGEHASPVVVVSVLPQAYFVERIAGDLVEVAVMIPPGASPATFEPTMNQMRTVSGASVYVKVGHLPGQ